MCLTCAIPVRGITVGQECLAVALGDEAPPESPPITPPVDVSRWITAGGFAVAVVATLLPWSRFGTGSEPFGAWGDSFRWSLVAAVAGVVGLFLAATRPRSRGGVVVAAAIVVAASILSVADPPAFTSPWLGPWIALAGGATALVGAGMRLGRFRRATTARV
jgi:hypothetical protein